MSNFLSSLSFVVCGGAPVPLDYLADTGGIGFPSLELIRERGLGIIYDAPEYYHLKTDPYEPQLDPRCAADRMRKAKQSVRQHKRPPDTVPGFSVVVNRVALPWQELGYTVENEPASVALRAPMAECLRRGSGLPVVDDKPYVSFLMAVDKSWLRRQNPVSVATVQRWSVLYADCAADYWNHVGERLAAERPGAIERNREVLQTFATNLSSAGYTP
ncbi:MAG: hypothetical protein NTV23_05830 [Propionibacteriales bacterium]|nr:hypothetical protein [Propionibacteriales bacterium]